MVGGCQNVRNMFGPLHFQDLGKRPADSKDAAVVRALIAPQLPGAGSIANHLASEAAASGGEPEPAAFKLFDEAVWSVESALWLLGVGDAIASDEQASLIRKTLRQRSPDLDAIARDGAWPQTFAAVLAHYFLRARQQLKKHGTPGHMHEWIRFARATWLPVAPSFWDSYYRWKCARWQQGFEVAWLSVARPVEGDTEPSAHPITPTWIPAETVWHQPLGFEAELSRRAKEKVFYAFMWKLNRGALFEAVQRNRNLFDGKGGDSPARRIDRVRQAGSLRTERIAGAIEGLAKRLDVPTNEAGRFEFRMKRLDLIEQLRQQDSTLADIPESTFNKVLAGFVVGQGRGRPPKP